MQSHNIIKSVLSLYAVMFLIVLIMSGCRRQETNISNSYDLEVLENSTEDIQNILENNTENIQNTLENNTENIQNTLEVEARQDSVEVKVHNQRDYEVCIEQLEKYNNYHYLHISLCGTDTVIYLDELLKYHNFGWLQINNGGIICIKDLDSFSAGKLWSLELNYISMLQEGLLNHLNGMYEICIRLDNRYTGKLPTMELLDNMDCKNIVLTWDDNDEAEGIGQLNGEDTYNGNNREWEYLYATLPKENQYLKGLYRMNEEDYSYTSYEFYGTDSKEVCAVFVCIKDHESDGKAYFDILKIPESALPNISRLYGLFGRRIYLEDINFDGYKDLLFSGDTSAYHKCTGFLWDDSEKRYQLCETAPLNFEWADGERKRLIYSTSGSAFDGEYYIYKYNGSAFEEERLEVEIPRTDEGWPVVWQYFKDDKLQKELEVDYDEDTDMYMILYYENDIVSKETMSGEDIDNVWEIGKLYFPEFDFYNFG